MNVLLDTNVVLDVLLNRAPWVSEAANVWDAHHQGRLTAYVTAFSIPTIFYVIRKQNDLTEAPTGLREAQRHGDTEKGEKGRKKKTKKSSSPHQELGFENDE